MTRVELFGVPRLLIGHRSVYLDAEYATLGDAARALGDAYPALLGKVLDPASGWIVDGYTFALDDRFTRDPASPVRSGATLLLVSSQAGG